MNISVCMIVRDEEQNLIRSLASIPKTFEVVVLDTGSSDRSVEIARSHRAHVYESSWNNNFAEARNICASYASGDYILSLDADEVLPEDCLHKLEQFINYNPNEAGSVIINNEMEDGIKHHKMIRFYPNRPEFQFVGKVHEQIFIKDGRASFKDTEIIITHYGYREEVYRTKNKVNRYLPLYLSHLQEYPDDGYMWYQLGKLYYGVENYTEAEQALYRSLQINETSALYFPVMVVMLGYVLKDTGRSRDAYHLLTQYILLYPLFPDIPFLLGLLAMDTGNIGGIETYFRQAIEIGETTKYSSVAGVGTYKAAYNLGVFYEITGNKESAKRYYKYSAEFNYKEAAFRLNEL
jgi:glycosyltransferase involved in cell wall biosynthesis